MNSDAMSFTIGFTAGGAVTLALTADGTTACSLLAVIMVVVVLVAGVVVAMKNSERVKMAIGVGAGRDRGIGPPLSRLGRIIRAVLTCFGSPGPAELMGPLPPLSLPSLPSPLPFSPLPYPTLSSPPLRSRPLKSS